MEEEEEEPVPVERCQSVGTFTLWGTAAQGMDVRKYSNNTLQWVGISSNGGNPANFYCTYDATADTLSFGTKA
jgi:hypothetical protein